MEHLVAYTKDGVIKFRMKRTDYGEMLQSFFESGLPRHSLFWNVYKVYWKFFKKGY